MSCRQPSGGRPCSKGLVSVCLKEPTSALFPMNIKRFVLGMFPSAMWTSKGEYCDSGPRESTILFCVLLQVWNDVNMYLYLSIVTLHCLPSTCCRPKKKKQTQNHTEPRYITSHTTHTHLLFLPPSGVFLMVHENLNVYM